MVNPCIFCSAECCKTYTITTTIFDILRIASKARKNPEDVCFLHEPRLLSYDPDMVLDTSDGYGYYLLGIRSHPCRFLDDNNRCSIHAFAPLSCKRYPYKLDGKLNPRFCPLASQIIFRFSSSDIPHERLVTELEAHKRLVKAWNRKKGTKEECIGFLIEKARARSL